MKNILYLAFVALLGVLPAKAQQLSAPPGKLIYIPKDLWNNDFTSPDSKWSYARMAYTDDVVIFWEKAFGDDPANAPDLDGHPMKVDIPNLLARLEDFYVYYRDTLEFVLPGSKSERYRMMVMLNYSLEGTAYGGDYDQEIGALWIAPNRVQDKKLNCIAHELGHSFQSQVMCDRAGAAWGGCPFFEMASQWMLWQVNPAWTSDENYHWQAFRKSIHKPFLAIENIYRSPYVLEYWAMKHGKTEIGNLFRAGRIGEDPAQTYMRLHGLSIEDMNREMVDCYSRLLSFDFPRVKASHKAMIGQLEGTEEMGTWGFNVIPQDLSAASGRKVTIDLSAYYKTIKDNDYRYQLVGLDKAGEATYYGIHKLNSSATSVKLSSAIDKLYLVVVKCPKGTYKPQIFAPDE